MLLQHIFKNLMKARGYTYDYMGEKMGKSKQSVWAVVNGKKNVTLEQLLKYADILDCELVLRSKTQGRQEWIITESKLNPGSASKD